MQPTVQPASAEEQLAAFAAGLSFDAIPESALASVRRIVLAVTGTLIAGIDEDGVPAVRRRLAARGGTAEATVLVTGERLPATSAAMINAMTARALDYCDAMAPGPHCGAAVVMSALAVAEKVGGCSGRDFLTAVVVGAEVAARMNRGEAGYDGFDPTGVSVVFGAAAAAGRLLGLDRRLMRQALALAFNRCAGSFQSNVDGSLAVRTIQGWVAEAGIDCAELAAIGITGPANFIDGVYGYGYLFRHDRTRRAGEGEALPEDTGAAMVADLGTVFRLERGMFKKYPSCGVTQGVTELALAMVADHGVGADDVAEAEVRLPPYAHRLVGKPFSLGDNPRVDAQFSAAWCVANALARRASRLEHFRPAAVDDPAIHRLLPRIRVIADPALDARGHSAVDLRLTTADGRRLARGLDISPGFPGNPLAAGDHRARFDACLDYAGHPDFDAARGRAIVDAIEDLHRLSNVLDFCRLLVADSATLEGPTSRPSRQGIAQ